MRAIPSSQGPFRGSRWSRDVLVRAGVLAALGALAGACVDLRLPLGASGDGGPFVAYKKVGDPCQTGDQCQSGFCYDSVCCMSKCEGKCMTCGKSGSEGFCMFSDVDT